MGTDTDKVIEATPREQMISKVNEQSDIVKGATTFVVAGQGDVDEAMQRIKDIRALNKEVTATFGGIKASAYDTYKLAMAELNRFADPLKAAEQAYKATLGTYAAKAELKRKQEAEKEAERLRKAAEREADKATTKIEKMLAGMGDATEQLAAIQAQLDNPETPESEINVLIAKRDALESKIRNAQAAADQVAQEAAAKVNTVPLAKAKTAAPKLGGGSSVRFKKEGTVVNMTALVQAVAAGHLPIDLLTVNTTKMNGLIKAGMQLAGVTVRQVPIVAVRGA